MSFISGMNREDMILSGLLVGSACVARSLGYNWTAAGFATAGAALFGLSYFQERNQAQAGLVPVLQTLEREIQQAQRAGTFEANKASFSQRYLALQPHVLPNSCGHPIIQRVYGLFSTPAAASSPVPLNLSRAVPLVSSSGNVSAIRSVAASSRLSSAVITTDPAALHINTLRAKAAQQRFIPFYGERSDHDPLTHFLGNFASIPVTINFGDSIGPLTFTCSESAFQAAKFAHDPQNRPLIVQFQNLNGAEAFALAGKNPCLVNPAWVNKQNAEQGHNVLWMKHIVDQKFKHHPEAKQLLLATGSAYLVEHSPLKGDGITARDTFWANGYNGTGKNLLGQILMETRENLGGRGVAPPPAEYTTWLQTGAQIYHTQDHPIIFDPLEQTRVSASQSTVAPQPTRRTSSVCTLRLPNVPTQVSMTQGDIVNQIGVEGIVNAANPQLVTGGGVAGAIFNAAGTLQMARLCSAYPQGCQPGNAVVTKSGELINKGISWVIHGVAPIYDPNQHEASCHTLYQTYRCILGAAKEYGIKTLAIPALGTLNYGFPMEIATAMQLQAIADYVKANPQDFTEIRLVFFSAQELAKAQTATSYFK